jgi:hypothetical protein
MFDALVDTLIQPPVKKLITKSEFDEFNKCWTWYLLADKRYGQAFCEHFGIDIHTPLYHFTSIKICRDWIKENYLEKKIR